MKQLLSLIIICALLLPACSSNGTSTTPETEDISYSHTILVEGCVFDYDENKEIITISMQIKNDFSYEILNPHVNVGIYTYKDGYLDYCYLTYNGILGAGESCEIESTEYFDHPGIPLYAEITSVGFEKANGEAVSVFPDNIIFDINIPEPIANDNPPLETENSAEDSSEVSVPSETDVVDSSWTYLTECKEMSKSNYPSNGSVKTGSFTDIYSRRVSNALRFSVADRDGWSNMEFIKYHVDGKYTEMSGLIMPEINCNENALMQVRVYLDNTLIYETEEIAGDAEEISFYLDITDADVVRVECLTREKPIGYCLVTAAVR